MSDQESDFDGGASPVENLAVDVSDKEVDEQGGGIDIEELSADEEEQEQGTESSGEQATLPSTQNEGGTQDSSLSDKASFQLSGEVGDVFEAGSDSDSDVEINAAVEAVTNVNREDGDQPDIDDGDSPPVKRKRRLLSDSDLEEAGESSLGQTEEDSPFKKRRIEDDASDGEGPSSRQAAVEDDDEDNQDEEDEASELQAEVADLGGVDDEGQVLAGNQEEGVESDEEPEDRGGATSGMSDWDIMMQRRKDAMARARKRRRRDGFEDLGNDEHIVAMIAQMKMAAEEDRHLNMERKAATKKLQMLPTVVTHLKKVDLVTAFIENGILPALTEWITPLPDHSLPHLKIRESILDILKSFPVPDAHTLKHSKIGKAVMLLYRHPKETRKNREKAGKIINEWARPIFGLASDFKSLSREEREERDYAHLSQSKEKRLSSSGERRPSQDDDYEPQKPGDKGWVGRARVPMPSTNDYVVRPKWNVEQKLPRKASKKVMNRYEKQMQKEKQRKMQHKTTHAVSISIEGRNMPL